MAYNTKEVAKDAVGNPISQYYNPVTDKYEPVEGSGGGNKVVVYNADGSENNNIISLVPILDKLSQLTGTVIDENTRKSNELLRIALYDNIENLLNTGQLKGDKGDIGLGLQFSWSGTQLGVRVEGQPTYTYVQLKGDKGDTGEKGETGDIANLTKQHVTDALGYTPPTQDTNTTYAEITTAEIDTGTAATLRTITARRVKYILDKVQTWVDLLMPKSGGVLENYTEKLNTTTGTINLNLGNVFYRDATANTTFSISNPKAQSHSFTLYIEMGETVRTLTFPASIKWQGGEIPDLSTVNKTYVLTFMTLDGGTTWLGMFGGEF